MSQNTIQRYNKARMKKPSKIETFLNYNRRYKTAKNAFKSRQSHQTQYPPLGWVLYLVLERKGFDRAAAKHRGAVFCSEAALQQNGMRGAKHKQTCPISTAAKKSRQSHHGKDHTQRVVFSVAYVILIQRQKMRILLRTVRQIKETVL